MRLLISGSWVRAPRWANNFYFLFTTISSIILSLEFLCDCKNGFQERRAIITMNGNCSTDGLLRRIEGSKGGCDWETATGSTPEKDGENTFCTEFQQLWHTLERVVGCWALRDDEQYRGWRHFGIANVSLAHLRPSWRRMVTLTEDMNPLPIWTLLLYLWPLNKVLPWTYCFLSSYS
jgi:hypothetical protein